MNICKQDIDLVDIRKINITVAQCSVHLLYAHTWQLPSNVYERQAIYPYSTDTHVTSHCKKLPQWGIKHLLTCTCILTCT